MDADADACGEVSLQLREFLAQKDAFGDADPDAYFNRLQDELDRAEALVRQQHDDRVRQINAVREYGRSITDAARDAWAGGLGEGASEANATDKISSGALVRSADARLLSLALAGYAEIEYVLLLNERGASCCVGNPSRGSVYRRRSLIA